VVSCFHTVGRRGVGRGGEEEGSERGGEKKKDRGDTEI
jgi:hypothetical protein